MYTRVSKCMVYVYTWSLYVYNKYIGITICFVESVGNNKTPDS